jgi:hypothetical protein
MQVCVPSTPAQMFHVLRRQMLRHFRKPLILMTPKSLLRHELSVSPLQDFTRGGFCNVIGEIDELAAESVRRIVFCAGKVYFDLLKARRKEGIRELRWCASNSCTRFPARNTPRSCGVTRTRVRSCGARRSRRIRVPGIRSAIACRSLQARAARCCTPAAPRLRRLPRDLSKCTRLRTAGDRAGGPARAGRG